MLTQEMNTSTFHEDENKIIDTWRKVVAESQQIDEKLSLLEHERDTLLLENKIVAGEIHALTNSYDDAETENSGAPTLQKIQDDIEKYDAETGELKKRANDLEAWCTKRAAKNQSHLETLQKRACDLRKRAVITEDAKALSPAFKSKQKETVEIEKEASDLRSAIEVNRCTAEKCSSIQILIKDLEGVFAQITKIKKHSAAASDYLTQLRRMLAEADESMQSLLPTMHSLEEKAREVGKNLAFCIKRARVEQSAVNVSDLKFLEHVRNLAYKASAIFQDDEGKKA